MADPVNDPSIRASKDDEDPYVLYLVVRESLGMSPGKIAAQVGHGVQLMMLEYMSLVERVFWDSPPDKPKPSEDERRFEQARDWMRGAFRKVVLKADDKEWAKLKAECSPYFLVRDAGLTQVAAGSETVICLWPMRKSERPKAVKRLQALP